MDGLTLKASDGSDKAKTEMQKKVEDLEKQDTQRTL